MDKPSFSLTNYRPNDSSVRPKPDAAATAADHPAAESEVVFSTAGAQQSAESEEEDPDYDNFQYLYDGILRSEQLAVPPSSAGSALTSQKGLPVAPSTRLDQHNPNFNLQLLLQPV